MELGKGVSAGYEQGELFLKVKVAEAIKPKLEEIKAKVQSGEIDLIKSTSLDNSAMVMAIDFLIKELEK